MTFWEFMQYRMVEALLGAAFTLIVVGAILVYCWVTGKSVGDLLNSKKEEK